MTIRCKICQLQFDDTECDTTCPHEQFLSVKNQRQKDLAVSLIGKRVAFHHMPNSPVRITGVGWTGMVTVDGMSGEFAPSLFRVVK